MESTRSTERTHAPDASETVAAAGSTPTAYCNRLSAPLHTRGRVRRLPARWRDHYCHRYAERNPLGYACLDLLSLAMGRLRAASYWELKNHLEEALGIDPDPALRRHVALDDAVQQARVLVTLLARADYDTGSQMPNSSRALTRRLRPK